MLVASMSEIQQHLKQLEQQRTCSELGWCHLAAAQLASAAEAALLQAVLLLVPQGNVLQPAALLRCCAASSWRAAAAAATPAGLSWHAATALLPSQPAAPNRNQKKSMVNIDAIQQIARPLTAGSSCTGCATTRMLYVASLDVHRTRFLPSYNADGDDCYK
jgi:hypothetical protein